MRKEKKKKKTKKRKKGKIIRRKKNNRQRKSDSSEPVNGCKKLGKGLFCERGKEKERESFFGLMESEVGSVSGWVQKRKQE